jgi:Bacterial regulatory proteins, luxR family
VRSPSIRDGVGLSIPSTFLQTAIGSPLWASALNTGSLLGDFCFFKPAASGCLAKIRDQLWLGFVITHSNKQISSSLAVTKRTVKAHMTSILGRIGVGDRTQAALWAQRHGVA